jgi:hypothetical protein
MKVTHERFIGTEDVAVSAGLLYFHHYRVVAIVLSDEDLTVDENKHAVIVVLSQENFVKFFLYEFHVGHVAL